MLYFLLFCHAPSFPKQQQKEESFKLVSVGLLKTFRKHNNLGSFNFAALAIKKVRQQDVSATDASY